MHSGGPVADRSGSPDDERFMRSAIEMARSGIEAGQAPFGACIVREGRIVACAHNEVWRRTDITAHAEVVALRTACRSLGTIDLSGCTIYATAEPCPMCFTACHWARMSRIVFAGRIADAAEAGFRELTISNHDMKRLGGSEIEIVADVLRDEARELFRLFADRPQRGVY